MLERRGAISLSQEPPPFAPDPASVPQAADAPLPPPPRAAAGPPPGHVVRCRRLGWQGPGARLRRAALRSASPCTRLRAGPTPCNLRGALFPLALGARSPRHIGALVTALRIRPLRFSSCDGSERSSCLYIVLARPIVTIYEFHFRMRKETQFRTWQRLPTVVPLSYRPLQGRPACGGSGNESQPQAQGGGSPTGRAEERPGG
ncbi:PREDICTED: uncharacterized protein LOC105583750 [Cercocebus atys]|uniref:uncharacterized protein LOC105583750 n=1 Tax=Cercocebus atys TaxID=9531 RepID=UPI0005F490D7|nr:PREDICTED: uncharacterized protein LOC105583750 [Cercocebus atys]